MSGKSRVLRTRRARQDLIEIWCHIGRDDPAAADRQLDRIDARCALLAKHPQLGPERADIRPGLRYLVVERYVILYRMVEGGVEIVRVVHGARNLPNLF
jgi:toxin ParE1/3/4